MKQSTVDSLRQCTDVEQIGDGALREDIQLAEKLCERMGNAEVPWPVLVGILVRHNCDRSGATLEAGLDAVTSKPHEADLGVGAEPSEDAEKKEKKALQMAAARAARSATRLANSAL